MALLITDPNLESELIAERQRCDGDRFDEVWEGIYVMAPLPNDEHQDVQANFVAAFKDFFGWDSLTKVRAGVNVSDRNEGWEQNYRCPDVVVFLPGTRAINHGGHWEGGPDFLIEIASDRDRAREKLPFYAAVGVREVLIVDRNPWGLELYASAGSPAAMKLVGAVGLDDGSELRSTVMPLSFQLRAAGLRPRINMARAEPVGEETGGRNSWLI